MSSEPRQGSARTATHVARLSCDHVAGDRYVCRGLLGNGSRLALDVVVSRDGKSFRVG